MVEIYLNLSTYFKGYLYCHIDKLNKCRFRTKSYSPVFVLIAKHLTEAAIDSTLSRATDLPANLDNILVYILLSNHSRIKTNQKNFLKNFDFAMNCEVCSKFFLIRKFLGSAKPEDSIFKSGVEWSCFADNENNWLIC